jgi:drug/metabolite transporter (DMT)-like permease
MSTSRQSMLLMIAFVSLWAGVDAMATLLTDAYSAIQVVWTRYGVHLAFMLLVWGWRDPLSLVATRRPVFQIARSLLMLIMPMSYILGVSRGMDSGTLLAVFWIAPLLVLVCAVVFLHERVSSLTWCAAAIAAAGAALLSYPHAPPHLRGLVWPLSMAISFSLYIVMTRSLRTESPRANLFYTALGVFLSVSLLISSVWVWPTLHDFIVMAAIGLCGCAGLYCLDRLTNAAPVADSAPLIGTQVVFTLATLAEFGQLHSNPELWIGLAFVGVAAAMTWWRIPSVNFRQAV